MDQNKVTPEEAKKAYLTGHYPYMTQAFVIAANRVPAWRLASDGTPCSSWEVLGFAQRHDEEHPRKEGDPSFFFVTLEGAIGFCPTGVEYQVRWIFFPMEPGTERDALVKKSLDTFEKAVAEEQAAEERRSLEERVRQLEAENKRLQEALASGKSTSQAE